MVNPVKPSPSLVELAMRWTSLAVIISGMVWAAYDIWSQEMALNHTEKVLLIEQLKGCPK